MTEPEHGEYSLRWVSSKEDVVTVDANGILTAVGYGSAEVTAYAIKNEAVFAVCSVRVVQPVTDISLDRSQLNLDTVQNKQYTLTVSYEPEDANFGQNITWHNENDQVVRITPSGTYNERLLVEALSCGTSVITATAENGQEVFCNVSVQDIVYASSVEELGSNGVCTAGMDRVWVYTDESRNNLVLQFSENCYLPSGSVLEVQNGEGEVITQFSGRPFGGERVLVPDHTVRLHLTTQNSGGSFQVASIIDLTSFDGCEVDVEDQVFTGKPLTPKVTVRMGGGVLPADLYTVSYRNNLRSGFATVTCTGKGILRGKTLTGSFRIYPQGIDAVSAEVVAKGIKLSWDAPKGAGKIDVLRRRNRGEYEVIKTLTGTTKTFTDTTVDTESGYTYQLQPYAEVKVNGDSVRLTGESAFTDSLAKLGPITGVTAQINAEGVTVSWDPVPGAERYNVLECAPGSEFRTVATVTGTQYSGSLYYGYGCYSYKIVPRRYVSGVGELYGCASQPASVYKLSQPNLYVYSQGTGVALYSTHYYNDEATGIEIYRSVNGAAYKKLKSFDFKNGRGIEFADSTARTGGAVYTYKARAYKTVGRTTYYGPYSQEQSVYFLQSVKTPTVKQTDQGFAVSWTPVPGATGYRIYRLFDRDGNFDFSPEDVPYATFPVDDTNRKLRTLTYTDTNVSDVGFYRYAVEPYGSCQIGDTTYSGSGGYWGSTLGYLPATPQGLTLSNGPKSISVWCEFDAYASGYEFWRSTGDGKWTMVKSVNTNGFEDTRSLKDGEVFQYRVRSFVKIGRDTFYSPFSQVESIARLTAPTLKTIKQSASGFEVSFSPVKNVGYYSVAVVSASIYDDDFKTVFYKELANIPSQRLYTVDCNVNLEKDHIYYVYATANLVQNGVDSTASDYYKVMVYGPSQLRAETTADGVRLSVPDYKDEYEVYRSTDGKRWTKVRATVEDAENWCAVDKTALVGTTYQYKVRATTPYAKLCISEDSNVVTCKRLAGPTLQPPENTSNGVRLVWTKAKGTTDECEYYIYRRQWGSDFAYVGRTSGTSYVDASGLSANTFYEYRIAQVTSTETRYSTIRKILHMKPVILSSDNCRFTGSNKAFVYWDYDGPVSGAEIRYRDGSLVRIAKPRNNSNGAEIIGLSNKKTYQISVRVYYKEGLVTYYSDWSNEVTLSP